MREIVIISGKGGTGKTSITASFAALASGKAVMADCDVDAADLHLILKPDIRNSTEFRSGYRAFVNEKQCVECGKCAEVCRFNAVKSNVSKNKTAVFSIDPVACEGCGVCVRFCPVGAIGFSEEVCGHWCISDTRFGKMVHAKLNVAAENSGKLVTLVRKEAKKIAIEQGMEFVLIDGSPGIGCPVIASLTAASIALIVTEPTISGDHDLQRIARLTKQLGVPTFVCVNKWDINPDITVKIRKFAHESGIGFAGQVRYDKAITAAQRVEKSIMEYCDNGITDDIRKIWEAITIENDIKEGTS